MPERASRYHILGTAGHIDHGKTSLVRALTGTDTDRLPEERRRGMTIELGFAELSIGTARLGIVDVPGHERFVRTMVAGATGIDVALLVVAADDSVMPQTIEHVEVLQLLGIRHGVVAITKIDTVDAEMVELVTDDVQRLLSSTQLASAPIVPVSSTTGSGIEALREAIESVLPDVERTSTAPPFRLAVDRVFTVQGRGTVVTGSVLRGRVTDGETLEIWPGGDQCRVRGLQTHGTTSETLARGQRAAINLSGVDRSRLERGVELATPGYLEPSRMVDVQLLCLSSCTRPIKSGGIVRVEIGTRELAARVVLLKGGELAPGDTGYAQLRSGETMTVTFGQRFIIRDETGTRTIGGGGVLRPVARRRRRPVAEEMASLERLLSGGPAERLEEVLRYAGFSRPTDLHLCARTGIELDELSDAMDQLSRDDRWIPVADSGVSATPGAMADLQTRLVAWLECYHRAHPELPGRPADSVLGWLDRIAGRAPARPLLEMMIEGKAIKRLGRFICLPAFAPTLSGADEKLMSGIIAAVRDGAFQPPYIDDIALDGSSDRKRRERLVTLAVALGELVRIDARLYLATETEEQLRTKVAALVGELGQVTVANVREALDSSRKYVVPFMEYLDRIGFTKRFGDHRVLAEKQHG